MILEVIQLLSDVKEMPELVQQLTAESSIVEDVGLDSLLMIHFILAVEEKFELEVDFEQFNYDDLKSIQAFCDFLNTQR